MRLEKDYINFLDKKLAVFDFKILEITSGVPYPTKNPPLFPASGPNSTT